MVPLNLLGSKKSADYVNTGEWSKKAIKEARFFCQPEVIASSEGKNFTCVPAQSEWKLNGEAAYVHYTANETIGGVEFHWTPETGDVPLVCDMSSNILSRPVDVSRYGVIYAGAQKNIGPSGVTVVIARKDLVDQRERKDLPKILKYSTYAKNNSLYNTPPTFGIYLMRNVLLWLKGLGGVEAVGRRNEQKGTLLYEALDRMSGFYRAPVEKESRSFMNVVFSLPNEALDAKFVDAAKKEGMVGLKGHRLAGGIRVSLYNAVAPEHVQTLVSFMERFARANG
jgi:phosphoserine aminotransferase